MIKQTILFFVLSLLLAGRPVQANEPDSAYLFLYATDRNAGRNGLHFAWSRDGRGWNEIGPEYGFLKCDYGRWGAEKRMVTPCLVFGADGLWHCVWSLNESANAFAHAASSDLVDWQRQSYPYVGSITCLEPVVGYDRGVYTIAYRDGDKYYAVTTTDFKTYTPASEIAPSAYAGRKQRVELPGGYATGQVHRVAWDVVDKLIKAWELRQYKNAQNEERTAQDGWRFAGLKPLEAVITVRPEEARPISDLLIGIFFEDISYAADGGLYAELVQNRDFEYTPRDKQWRDKNWNATYAWSLKGGGAQWTTDTLGPIHPNNPHYAVLDVQTPGAALVNGGYDGISLKKGESYDISLFARRLEGKGGRIVVRLTGAGGNVVAETRLPAPGVQWKKYTGVLTATADVPAGCLEVMPEGTGKVALDMVSLFPQNTFKGRKNGLRADLAQAIADIRPRFVRFPGGCVAHGDGLHNIYRWVNTVGPLEARKPQPNLWRYHQTAGLGYFEYFQFCEDIGAEPLPVLAAGVPCQNSGDGGGGQQGGIPLCEMDAYVQEILDLVEYANGDAKNTRWGRVRAQAGHPAPFNLKYIGIGNEDLITDVFEERFEMIYKALKEKHPEITVIGTVGPASEGTDYREGWEVATRLGVPMVDEHYYQQPGWFIHNQDYYDRYDRNKPKVYLGEYAAHLPGRPNNVESALSEALYLTAVERNGDVVSMTSYAPLLAKEGKTNWNPDLIYFNNQRVRLTPGYYVQKLYGENSGNQYLPSVVALSEKRADVAKRVAVSVVRDSLTGCMAVKMVNLLPVPVRTRLELPGADLARFTASRTVLSGDPADRKAVPHTEVFPLPDDLTIELPAYSFTVISLSPVKEKKKR